jgi:hypothetical protein
MNVLTLVEFGRWLPRCRTSKVVLTALAALVALAGPIGGKAIAQERDGLGWSLSIEDLGWTYRSTSSDEGTIMYSRPFPGMPRRSWTRFEYRDSQDPVVGRRFLSSMVLFEFDCVQRRSRGLQASYYTANNLSGEGRGNIRHREQCSRARWCAFAALRPLPHPKRASRGSA